MDNIVIHITNGWYDFTKLDQSKNYIKIHALNCGTNKKAPVDQTGACHAQRDGEFIGTLAQRRVRTESCFRCYREMR